MPGVDRLLKKEEAQILMAAPHARRMLSCQDRACCPGGFEDTLKDPKGHYLRQRKIQCEALSKVQDQLKAHHFLGKMLAGASKTARQVSKLKTGDEGLGAVLAKNAARLERMGEVLENLHETEGEVARAHAFADFSQSEGNSRVQGERQ